MGRVIKWTEKKISRMVTEGYGRGAGASYMPWIQVAMVSSLGRSRRVFSPKTGRVHHLLSDVEYRLFLALEWQRDITDIREQYPLDRALSQEIADGLHIRHPCYPTTFVKTVMTADFLVTRVRNGAECLESYNAKCTYEAQDMRSMDKLEIQRSYFAKLDIPHHLVFDTDIPLQKIKNIDWIRDSLVKDGEAVPHPDYWKSMTSRMTRALYEPTGPKVTLAAFCNQFDATHGAEQGTGLRAARMLMAERVLTVNLDASQLTELPLANFMVTGSQGNLRAVGGQ